MKPSVRTGETGRTRGCSPSMVARNGKRAARMVLTARSASCCGSIGWGVGRGMGVISGCRTARPRYCCRAWPHLGRGTTRRLQANCTDASINPWDRQVLNGRLSTAQCYRSILFFSLDLEAFPSGPILQDDDARLVGLLVEPCLRL